MTRALRFVLQAALALATLLTLSACALLRIDDGSVFMPRQHPARLAGELDIAGEDKLPGVVHEALSLSGERIAISRIPSADPGAPLIVSCFGNASDRRRNGADYLAKIAPFGEALVWDYPGYGDSSGAPTSSDIDRVLTELVPELERRAGERPLVFWGHSLGGFVCAQMASRSSAVDAVVLETTAPDVKSVAESFKPGWLPVPLSYDKALLAYDTPRALAEFDGPVLILGAGRDRVLEVALSRKLAEALPDATYLELPEATHYSAGFDPRARAAISEMLATLP